MKKSILLINDLPGYGRAALSVMLPVLSRMGYHVYNLPTALVSNTLDYGKFAILETTDYMKNAFRVWEELGFRFDAISTGFLVSAAQTELIIDYCKVQKRNDTKLFADPILGDEGKLYNGVTEQTIENMRKLVAVADYIVPNYTEACYLAKLPYKAFGMTKREAEELLTALRDMGAASIVVTSAKVDGRDAVIGYDRKANQNFMRPFSPVPAHFFGTGDMFSSVLIGRVLEGFSLQDGTQRAMDVVKEMIVSSQKNGGDYKGIPVELFLESIKIE